MRRRKYTPGQNIYFDRKIPLYAPEDGFEIRKRRNLFTQAVHENTSRYEVIAENHFEGTAACKTRGKRSFAYPVMSLMIRKEYGDVKAAMEEMIGADYNVEFKPFIVKEGDEYVCLGGPKNRNPFGGQQSKEYDPTKETSIGQQLSVGKAAKKGDRFEWSSTINY